MTSTSEIEVDDRVFEQALQPGVEYVDATAMMKAMARRIKQQDAQLARMERVLDRLAGVLEPLAKRSVEHTADINLLKLKQGLSQTGRRDTTSLHLPLGMKN